MRTKLAFGAVAIVSVAAVPAWAEAWDLVLFNETGKTIKEIELSPTGAGTWQANNVDPEIKPDKSVAPGARTNVNFERDEKQCRWDVKLTFSDDTNTIWPALDVCTTAMVTVRYNKSHAPVFAAK